MSAGMPAKKVVVLGAGVTGLTTALLLSREGDYSITIVAKHMPGDYDIEYASPWAGANYLPVSKAGTRAATWDLNTWPELARLAQDVPEAGVHFQDIVIYRREKDVEAGDVSEKVSLSPWFKDTVPNFRHLAPSSLPNGVNAGTAFTSVCINTALYLPWLASQCLKHGVVLKRGVLAHVTDAANLHHSGSAADVVVNCTGLGAAQLGGVRDKTLTSARGQTVLVRNTPGAMYGISGTDDGSDEVAYIMQRAAGGGTILGGCVQVDRWEPQPDADLAQRIMRRAVELCPAMVGGQGVEGLDIIRHGVGLRPLRQAGTRLEKEKIGGVWVVHSYGHAGYGYQCSYGCAQEAVKLVDQAFAVDL